MDQYSQYATREQHAKTPNQSQGARWSRVSLRVLIIVCNATNIGFAASHSTHHLLVIAGPCAGFSTLWSLFDVFFLFWRQGIHPAPCIGVDGLLTVAFAGVSGLMGFAISKLSDSGWYFAFLEGDEDAEQVRIMLGFGIITALFHLTAVFIAIWELRRSSRLARHDMPYAPGHMDGSFPEDQRRGFGEAPPAYSGPSPPSMHPPEDSITRLQQTFEPPSTKSK